MTRADSGETLGRSRQGRPISGYRFGHGPLRISLLGGCHADEPVGPRLLRHLVRHLADHPDSPLVKAAEWWIVPHINPDGAARNRAWQPPGSAAYELTGYLAHAVRELPGDDIEFGFPRSSRDDAARPEPRAVRAWWATAEGPFALHVSLHGMAFAGGPWYLIEPAWTDRAAPLMERCAAAGSSLGYRLHDVERGGEKGFVRLAPGFSTRPDSRAMRDFFEERGDPATAGRFRPSSMESVRDLGGDPLTLVSEMPLFVTPGVGRTLGPPDPAALRWRERIADWRARLGDGAKAPDRATARTVRDEATAAGLRPMPVIDQMRLQWHLILSGLQLIRSTVGGSRKPRR